MVMAEKSFPAQVMEDLKELFHKGETESDTGKPGSEQPAPGKCGCHPGGIHHEDSPADVEQRDVDLIAIPVKVENIVSVRTLPAKRGSLDTFYPSNVVPAPIQGKDPRIKRLIIQATVQNCWVGPQESIKALAGAGTGTQGVGCYLLVSGIPVVWEGIDFDIWAVAATAGSIVSVRREYWPDV
jgi:hypothetical protein